MFRWIYPDEPECPAGQIAAPTGHGLAVNLDRERARRVLRVTADGVEALDALASPA